MGEVAGGAAECQNEVVIDKGIFLTNNLSLSKVEIDHPVEQHRDIRLVRQNRANRLCDIRRGKPRGGDLVEQWLEQMMVLTINQRDARFRLIKAFAEYQSSEA